jgi:hypothetical protein
MGVAPSVIIANTWWRLGKATQQSATGFATDDE